MASWKNASILPTGTIMDAVKIIDKAVLQIALVVDENEKLVGTITDGDVRRGIIKGFSFDMPVTHIMKSNPLTLPSTATDDEIRSLMQEKSIRHVVLVHKDQKIDRLVTLSDYTSPRRKSNKVVLMAGGLGTRLLPLTKDSPKPLLKVGNTPILQTLIQNFMQQGFHDIVISTNYKADMIKDFCGDGKKFGVSISYIDEYKRLGTAGAISLLDHAPDEPFIVMNSDILTKFDFRKMLEFHVANEAAITMAIKENSYTVPYGVVQIEGNDLVDIVEKPTKTIFINGGIYILSPKAASLIPKNEFFDMPDLISLLIKQKQKVSVFPIREYWIDIGQISQMDKANGEFDAIFREEERQS